MARVLPVHVQPVETVAIEERDGAVDEALPGLRCQGHIGEPSGPRPPAHGNEYLQLRIALLEAVQDSVILRIATAAAATPPAAP